MSDIASYLRSLKLSQSLREDLLHRVIASLNLNNTSRILDVGCGIGLPALLLADALGPEIRITGLDIEPAFIEYARTLTEEAGQSDTISYKEGSADNLPFEDDSFDFIWSIDCIGYGPFDTPKILAEFQRVLVPGGSIALLFWSSQKVLPGYPALEARMSATSKGILPFANDRPPHTHPLRLLGQLQSAGFKETTAHTFAGDAKAPLTPEIREALLDLFGMLWFGIEPEISDDDQKMLAQLTDPESSHFILDLPDYYGFFTYSIFTGMNP